MSKPKELLPCLPSDDYEKILARIAIAYIHGVNDGKQSAQAEIARFKSLVKDYMDKTQAFANDGSPPFYSAFCDAEIKLLESLAAEDL